MKRLSVLLCSLALLATLSIGNVSTARAQGPTGITIFGLTTQGRLVSFRASAPQTLLSNVLLTGVQPGDVPLAIDFRPATSDLYMLTTSRLYRVDPDTGAAVVVGSPFTTGLNGTAFGFDFNPTVDRIRVVSNNEQNLRLNPDTGAVAFVDGSLAFSATDQNAGEQPNVVGAAYTNNFPGATTTTLYNIDSGRDILTIQNPPNDGVLTTVGGLGVDTTDLVGFDIQSGSGTAYASLNPVGATFSTLYTVNLATGLVTAIGNIGGLGQITDIAIPIGIRQGEDTVGVYDPVSTNWFLRNSNTPGLADVSFVFGGGGASIPLRGDYDGDGDDTAGTYVSATSTFFLRNSNSAGAADLAFSFGAGGIGLVPLVGDWNGDGVDTIGLYNPATGAFFLRGQNSSGPANMVFTFGAGGGGYVALAGDWNGDGLDTIGLYNPATGAFFLRNSNTTGPADLVFTYGPLGVKPITGDYDNNGTDTVGVYVAASATFFLRNTNSAGPADLAFTYGPANHTPLIGDWDGL